LTDKVCFNRQEAGVVLELGEDAAAITGITAAAGGINTRV